MTNKDMMIVGNDGVQTMTSREISKLTGKEHSNVMRDVRNMFSDLEIDVCNFESIYSDSYNRQQVEYKLDKLLSLTLVAGYSTVMRNNIIKRWQELENGPAISKRPLTQSAALLQSVQLMVELENRLVYVEEDQALLSVRFNEHSEAIEARIDEVEATGAWKVCPQNAENITRIRNRINSEYGLSVRIVDEVMRQSLYAPKPAGTVVNVHEESNGGRYIVYWKKDVSAVFKHFASECRFVTECSATHVLIEGKFRMLQGNK